MTQAQLTVWRNRLLSDWAQVRETLIGQLKACRRDEWAEKLDHCEQDQLVELTSRLDLPKVEQSVAHLKRIDAALCQMDLGLYGLCSDCEEPLAIESLELDPTLQRCPRCEARYRKVLQSKAHKPEEIYKLWAEKNEPI
ncbi:TraR/DksA family transcriptional regulator [Aeromonas jandaei]|uniref:TraR/DksA family transcriptional regulator n=1 Tax=Aeromonas jandaei TaxID=650 RepID=UPI00366B505C